MNILVAADRHWAIGKDGRGLVTIPADQQMLMRETAGKVVVMGRKTLEGLPGAQPLGNRVNVVLSGNRDYKGHGCAAAWTRPWRCSLPMIRMIYISLAG